MSKFTLHSMIKKSNRFSIRLSSVFGLHSSIVSSYKELFFFLLIKTLHFKTVDQEYDKLEAKFRCLEKLLKCFTKDSLQHLSNFRVKDVARCFKSIN